MRAWTLSSEELPIRYARQEFRRLRYLRRRLADLRNDSPF